MTTPADLLKSAAAEIDRLSAENAQLLADNGAMAQSIKTASEGQKKVAADLGALAANAAKTLLDKGLLKSAEDADKLAASILRDSTVAIKTIIKIAGYTSTVQKLGSVVLSDTSAKPETADEAWDRRMSALAP